MINIFKKFLSYRELLWNITLRELKVKYKKSALGFLWALVEPLMTILVYLVVFNIIIKFKIPNYPIFLLSAVLPWLYLQRGLNGSVNVFYANRSIVQKVYFPRPILPLSMILADLINFCLTLLIFGPVLLYFRQGGLSLELLWLPVVVLGQTLFIFGMSMVASLGNAFFRDTGYVLQVITRFWFYACPVFYNLEMVRNVGGKLYSLYMLNPMAVYIGLYRMVFLNYHPPETKFIFIAGIFTFFLVIFGLLLFYKYENSMVKQL
jgi:lipopolysaccharide transport system permease protein